MAELSRKDQYLLDQDPEAWDLKRKIKALEQEKSELVRKNEEQRKKIKLLMGQIKEFKHGEMEEQLESPNEEIDCFEEDKKTLKEQENKDNRLQHDLEDRNATAEELQQMKISFEEKIRSLEKENASLIEQMKRLTAEMELKIYNLQEETSAEILVKDMEIRRLKKHLEESKGKNSEKGRWSTRWRNAVEKLKLVKVLEGEGREYRRNKCRGLKLPWPLAASAGMVAAAAMIYLKNAKKRSS